MSKCRRRGIQIQWAPLGFRKKPDSLSILTVVVHVFQKGYCHKSCQQKIQHPLTQACSFLLIPVKVQIISIHPHPSRLETSITFRHIPLPPLENPEKVSDGIPNWPKKIVILLALGTSQLDDHPYLPIPLIQTPSHGS